MGMKSIQEAKDPDLRASAAALSRAAEAARRIAIQTGTNLIVVKDGKMTWIPAQMLRETTDGLGDNCRASPERCLNRVLGLRIRVGVSIVRAHESVALR